MLESFVINSLLITLVVLLHFEMLSLLSSLLLRIRLHRRWRVVIGVFGALCAHVLEIWCFGFGYYFLISYPGHGELVGIGSKTLLDCVYFSFTTYTSLGFGDLYPTGHLRFLSGLEALTGLVLIAWTASFMYLEMQKFWQAK